MCWGCAFAVLFLVSDLGDFHLKIDFVQQLDAIKLINQTSADSKIMSLPHILYLIFALAFTFRELLDIQWLIYLKIVPLVIMIVLLVR
jgi:hypothetical protein